MNDSRWRWPKIYWRRSKGRYALIVDCDRLDFMLVLDLNLRPAWGFDVLGGGPFLRDISLWLGYGEIHLGVWGFSEPQEGNTK